jgi:hypothetical protein
LIVPKECSTISRRRASTRDGHRACVGLVYKMLMNPAGDPALFRGCALSLDRAGGSRCRDGGRRRSRLAGGVAPIALFASRTTPLHGRWRGSWSLPENL